MAINNKNRKHSIALSIFCFFVSLQSYYFYQVALPLVSIVGLILTAGYIFFCRNTKRLELADFLTVSFLYFYLFEISALGFFAFQYDINLKDILRYGVLIFAALVFSFIEKRKFSSILSTMLVLHLFFFYVQFFSYYIFDLRIDYLEPFTGESQRSDTAYYASIEGPLFRATGLFNEPGTFACTCAVVTALFLSFPESRLRKLIIFFSILSLFISFSIYGLIFGSILLFFIRSELPRFLKVLASLVLCGATIFMYERFFGLSQTTEQGIGMRASFIIEVINFLFSDLRNLLFGTGLLRNHNPLAIDFPFNDASLIIYIVFTTGILGLLGLVPLAVLIFLRKASLFTRASFVILILSKISIFSPFFAFILVAILKSRGASEGATPKNPRW